MKLLITGATGNIGSLVVEELLRKGERPTVFVRDAEKARARFGDRVLVEVGDLADAGSLSRAFAGKDAVFLVSSGPDLEFQDAKAAAAAKAVRLKNLVKLSSMDVADQVGTGIWHGRGESAIRSADVPFTFVRPTGFMSNALYWSRQIKTEGRLRSSTGDGKIGFVHPLDIAAVSVVALTTLAQIGKVLPLTGPESLSYAEMTGKIGAEIGRSIGYESMTDEEAEKLQSSWGASPELVVARMGIFRAIREGRMGTLTDTVERVLGRPPINFASWCRENAAAFR